MKYCSFDSFEYIKDFVDGTCDLVLYGLRYECDGLPPWWKIVCWSPRVVRHAGVWCSLRVLLCQSSQELPSIKSRLQFALLLLPFRKPSSEGFISLIMCFFYQKLPINNIRYNVWDWNKNCSKSSLVDNISVNKADCERPSDSSITGTAAALLHHPRQKWKIRKI